ncbi:MAG TPA: right-handed parallel beta-helix repeat-containing protein [Ktedonobacterales bacterium]
MRKALVVSGALGALVVAGALAVAAQIHAGAARADAACTPTGFSRDSINLTARLINPKKVSGEVDAGGCNIGVYFGPGAKGTVDGAEIHGANYFGVVNDGGSVTIRDSDIHDIGESPLNGTQHGVGVYFTYGSGATGQITHNHLWNYQKGGIVVNGTGDSATIQDNSVEGQGPVSYIAQNGIQVGYGASASVMRNTVTGNAYTGTSTASGGIIVVGGPFYGGDYTTGTQIEGNLVTGNDIGIWITDIDAAANPPATQSNIKVVNNTISNGAVTNHYGGVGYQAGIADQGNNDKLIHNTISGTGYTPVAGDSPYLRFIDADASFTNRAKIHANVTP